MALSIDTILSLDANKSYYIANSTGEIAEATPWQKFKSFFGIGLEAGRFQKRRLHGLREPCDLGAAVAHAEKALELLPKAGFFYLAGRIGDVVRFVRVKL